MKIEFILSEKQLSSRITDILELLAPFRIWLFSGEIGSGKTTLVREIAKELGKEERISSPSYTLINEYQFAANKYQIQKLYHLDLYRLNNIHDALDIGIEELINSGNKCIIEWPEIVLSLFEFESAVYLYIENIDQDHRRYLIITENQ